MLTPGGTLGGRYRLDERIATGGMGDVWKAEDTVLGRIVAVKILQAALLEEPGFIERFRAEARVMATINHPGVVRVYDYGESDVDGGGKVAYLVMEHVDGEALSRTLSRVGRLTPERSMNLLSQAGDALQAAHEHGVVHRDVKPGNLLVRPDGKLVLTDFGIARSAMSGQLTTAGSILGTASYVSPEQASGSSAITPASDVYSLGVVGYQCLTGHRPFEGDNPVQVAMKHIRDIPAPLPADVPPGIREVVDRAMSKEPAQRWPSASEMATAARRAGAGGSPTGAIGSPAGARPDRTTMLPPATAPTSGPGTGSFSRGAAAIPATAPQEGYAAPGQPPRRRNRGLLIAGVVLAVLLVVGGIGGIGYALYNSGASTPDSSTSPMPNASEQSSQNTDDDNGDNNEVELDLNSYIGKSYGDAARDVGSKGLNPEKQFRSRNGFQPGTVTSTNLPKGKPAHKGDTLILYVQPDNDNDNGDDDGDGMPTLPGNGGHPTGDPTGGNSPPTAKDSPTTGPTPTEKQSGRNGLPSFTSLTGARRPAAPDAMGVGR